VVTPQRTVQVVQPTDSEYLGRIEDHLEGRGIRFQYLRPHQAHGWLPPSAQSIDVLFLLGGGPRGTGPEHPAPALERALKLVRDCLERDRPVVGFGLGAQLLAIAAGGGVEPGPLVLEVDRLRRVEATALGGYLPPEWPHVVYMRDRPVPPPGARVLAVDGRGRPALFQAGERCFGFCGHPGAKVAMLEDLVMEFEEAPADVAAGLERARAVQPELEDALVPIMAGLVQTTGLMAPPP
jgi:GMP synthase-like glutamine amidotransferase